MAKEFKMSQARYDELKQELDYSKTTRADEVAELIKEARGFGDLSENSEYDEAKNEQGKLYSRIAELEDILLHAVIVDESETDSDKISIGCTVTVTNLDMRKQMPAYKIVGSQEADVMSRAISEDSPFGKALMGRKAGDEVTVEAPKGVIHDLTVHGDVSNAKVGELHALDGVLCQLVNNGIIMQAGGNVGLRVPRAIVAGLGDVVLIDAQGCFFAGVDGRLGKCRGDEAQSHDSGHEHGQYAMDLFHLVVSFIKSDFLQK